MIDPIFWLVLSFLLVSVSLTAVLVVLVPAVVELSRAARSFERLCDTINRDLPPTLESLRQTTQEITHLTDDVHAGVQNAGQAMQQANQGLHTVRGQAKRAQVNTRSLMAGMGAAWAALTKPEPTRDRPASTPSPTPQSATRPSHPQTAPPPTAPTNQDDSASAGSLLTDSSLPVSSQDQVGESMTATPNSDRSTTSTSPPATETPPETEPVTPPPPNTNQFF
ncbi:MAG: hypothetical protein AAF722_08110 [Cyanobacteria bacterium P01_C01_bin.70]